MAHRLGFLPDVDSALDLPLADLAVLAVRALVTLERADVARVDGMAACPLCGVELELTFPLPGPDGGANPPPTEAHVATSIGILALRAVSSRDLLMIRGSRNPVEELLARCAMTAEGLPADAADLRKPDMDAIDAACEQLAGWAGLRLSTVCSACGKPIEIGLDPVRLWWDQVESSAVALLRQITTLASAFGWSESEVLGLSERRRATYVAMVTG
jgi:hypothetical protein